MQISDIIVINHVNVEALNTGGKWYPWLLIINQQRYWTS